EQNWRAITTPEPWYYFARVFDVIEGHWWMTIAIVSLAYGLFRVFRSDARFLAPSWFAGTVIAIGMVNVSTGGTAIPRAIVAALPGLFVLMGGSLSSLGAAVTTQWKWPRLSYVVIALVALLPTIPFTAKVVAARTGVLPVVDLVRREGGFIAARELDPWVPALSPSEVVLVGDKQALQPAEVRDRLTQDGTRPCFAALSKFVEVNGTVLILGNNDSEPVPTSEPTAVFRDDSARLEPAVLESFWGLGILTLSTLPTPELRLYRDEYLCREARPG
ncbi:MAG TPA: hypothetical protein VHX16_04065, partial [Chloroflexota bacterium]|nr:hypothetical protein [Chloroflexota bacterium]